MKALYAGAGLALTAGLLIGGAMKPQLVFDDRPAGPQTVAARAGVRASGPVDDGLSYASYPGQIPAYVTGTDAQMTAQAAVALEPGPATYAENYYVSPLRDASEPQDPREATPATDGAAKAEQVSLPSLDGGAAYDDVSRAEKTPVVRTADVEDESRPEAAGDVSVQR